MIVLAIDGGLATCGWAVVNRGQVVALGVLISKPKANYKLSKTRDRELRLREQVSTLAAIARQYGISDMAAETMSFPPRASHSSTACICLSWGGVTGIAAARGCPLTSVSPKSWQHAITPLMDGGTIDYAAVYAAVNARVTGPAAAMLEKIPRSHRNHALDACGIGLFAVRAALQPVGESADATLSL